MCSGQTSSSFKSHAPGYGCIIYSPGPRLPVVFKTWRSLTLNAECSPIYSTTVEWPQELINLSLSKTPRTDQKVTS